jgi:(1->4)-alpha-D-glucan 1-alpha-D-glucosylmutase
VEGLVTPGAAQRQWPGAQSATPAQLADYRVRVVAYMRKAGREAKLRTSWANENAPYEQETEACVRALLDDRSGNFFLEDLRGAVRPVAWVGLLNGLSLTAIKLTSPGVPDIYQGTEVWDHSLVDPDNRRPVDYERRRSLLAEVQALGDAPGEAALAELLAELPDGRAKLHLVSRLLGLRKEREALFRQGGYTVVRASGTRARHLVVFARRHAGEAVVTIAPRLIAGLGVAPGALPCGDIWGDTRVELPMFREGAVLRDVLTGAEHRLAGGGFAAATLLARFPVAVLRV